MAWEMSISASGWQEIHDKLETWGKARLIKAITEDQADVKAKRAERK